MNQKDFNVLHEQAASIIKRIKQKNDLINRGSVDSQQRLMQQINRDKEFFKREVLRLNSIIKQMEQNYVDPFTLRKVDTLKKQAKKQITRNEQLIKDLIRNTFDTLSQQHSQQSPPPKHSPEIQMGQKHSGPNQSQSQDQSLMMIHHQKLSEQLQAQKTKILKDFQLNIITVHEIMKQTEGMVYQQGETLDLISDAIQTTKENTTGARQNLDEAGQHQKRHMKYWVIAVIVLIVVAGIIVTVLMLTK